MPVTPESTDPDPTTSTSPATVRLSADVDIPQRFVQPLLTKLDGEDRYAQTRISVRIADDGEPLLERYEFVAPTGGLRAGELRRPDLPGLLQWAVEQRIASSLMAGRARAGGSAVELDETEVEAIYGSARSVAAQRRGPYRITDDFLAGVLGQDRTGGVKLVMKENDVSERTARRWLSEAVRRGIR